jgi:hypothetical protein
MFCQNPPEFFVCLLQGIVPRHAKKQSSVGRKWKK